MKTIIFLFLLTNLFACHSKYNGEHSKRLSDLIYEKEKLMTIQSQLLLIDTNSYQQILQNATIKLLNLESVLPKAISEKTADYLLAYRNSFFKINKSNEKRKVLLQQVNLEILQLSNLIADIQKELWIEKTEKEMVNREIDAAKSIILAETDFKRSLILANTYIKNCDAGIDSTINYYRKKKVE
jgi:hypothetical protein